MAESKKYYWLKLKRDFFKRHDIRIVESMPNGKDYILFYLKLLLESIDHEGTLRFSETIPYNEDMLAVVTNTNIDVVRSAMKLFVELNMMSICDDQTIYMTEVERLIGSAVDNDAANRQRRCRERKKAQALQVCDTSVTKRHESKIIETDTEIHIENKGSICDSQKRFTKPTLNEVADYCAERGNNVDAEKWYDYYESNGWRVGKNPMKDWRAAVRTWEKREEVKPTPGAQKSAPKYGSFDPKEALEAALKRTYE